MNEFIKKLADICGEKPLDEKWLIAPSLRVGNQWLESVARSGRTVVNVHVKTLKRMAGDLASMEMARRGVSPVSGTAAVIIVDRAWNRVREKSGAGYLSALNPRLELSEAIHASLNSLRMAELGSGDLDPRRFEEGKKGRELAAVYGAYMKALEKAKLVDYAEVLRMAVERLEKDLEGALGGAIVLIPDNGDYEPLEQKLIGAIPAKNLVRLPVPRPGVPSAGAEPPATDLDLLRFIHSPADAPAPFRDGSVEIFHAAGRMNEVREALRRCLSEKSEKSENLKLDQVELLHASAENYLPLIYEAAAKYSESAPDGAGLRITFAEGIPAGYSRPGRALLGWLEWISEGCPQKTLARMIEDGLLSIPEEGGSKFDFSQLGALLRSVPIGMGRNRYLRMIDEEIAALEIRPPGARGDGDEAGDDVPDWKLAALNRRKQGLKLLRRITADLLDVSPSEWKPEAAVLRNATVFIEKLARSVSDLDNFSRDRLAANMKDMADCIGAEDGPLSVDLHEWLRSLPGETRVLGSGPRPGHLHVDNIFTGGHTGRKHTFIIGLDDSLFPGGAAQDPLLLDGERKNLSDRLALSAGRVDRKLKSFGELLARLGGRATLGFSSRDLLEDRESFPASVLIDIYRIVSGDRGGDHGRFVKWLAPPASFAPDAPEKCLDETEWWMWRLLGTEKAENAGSLIRNRYPHLARGAAAAAARESGDFTKYDGNVPRAGAENDPFAKEGTTISAGRLEKIGSCPLGYFFRYILGVEPPEELEIDPYKWLDPRSSGKLMHKVFEVFYKELNGRQPEESDLDLLLSILERYAAEYRKQIPPPSDIVFKSEYRKLEKMARIFLAEELRLRGATAPMFFEVTIGRIPRDEDSEGSPLDRKEPVNVKLPGGGTIRAQGRIDRIDRIQGKKGRLFTILDYKTGGTYKYRSADPFNQGRVVQHALYLAMADPILKEHFGGDAAAAGFGFFFPSRKAWGERLMWSADELSRGGEFIEKLCRIAAAGCFLPTNEKGDCKFCDYLSVCGNPAETADASKSKLENQKNNALKPFMELRKNG